MNVKRWAVKNPDALDKNKHTGQLAMLLLNEKHAYMPPPEGPLEGEQLQEHLQAEHLQENHQQAEHLQENHQQDAAETEEENLLRLLMMSSQM